MFQNKNSGSSRINCRVLFCVCVVAILFREKRGSPFFHHICKNNKFNADYP